MTPAPVTGHHHLDPELIETFRRDGHGCVRGLATAEECAAYLPLVEEGVARWHPEPPPLDQRGTYERAFLQAMALRSVVPELKGFVDSPRFAEVAARLLGVDGVRLYHDQALVKEAGGGRTPWHQDQTYWPLDTDDTITMWMPLVDLDPDVGSMTFVDGSHRHGDVGGGEISDASDEAIAARLVADPRPTTTYGALRAGDATFHRGWTIHSAASNPTGRPRPVMTIIWFADGARATEPRGPEQRFDLGAWLGGVEPGARADAATNPLLWPVDGRPS